MINEIEKKIYWLGHAGFLIKSNMNIYIDPFKIREGLPEADILLITHSHYDHCSIEDIQKIASPNTIVVCPPDCQSNIARLKVKEMIPLTPGKTVEIEGIKITGFPAYNTNKPFHPKENEWLGYIIEIEGIRIYHAGDTDLIPEMNQLKGKIDIALLPVSGTYVMNAEEAARAVEIIQPRKAVAMHYGSIVGDIHDKERFEQLIGQERVLTLEKL
ncbi:MBL fold metallo-hydrolase [Candidatus Woesearchaeota archaeon]|nr:MBL fold metallo-hydrolase [Candidatus Woesearchaeota archaeon]